MYLPLFSFFAGRPEDSELGWLCSVCLSLSVRAVRSSWYGVEAAASTLPTSSF